MKAISSGEATVPEMLSALKKIDKSGMSEEWDGVRQRMQKELTEVISEIIDNIDIPWATTRTFPPPSSAVSSAISVSSFCIRCLTIHMKTS
jgi:hypothetical protein